MLYMEAKTWASNTGTGCSQQPGNVSKPKQGETPAKTPHKARPEDETPTETIRTPKEPRDLSGPRTYKEALTDDETAIFKGDLP
jgi:hypothetical protein